MVLKLGFPALPGHCEPGAVEGKPPLQHKVSLPAEAGLLTCQASLAVAEIPGFLPDPCCWPRGCNKQLADWEKSRPAGGTGLCWSWVWRPVVTGDRSQEAAWLSGGYSKTTGSSAARSGPCPLLGDRRPASLPLDALPTFWLFPMSWVSGTKGARYFREGIQARVFQPKQSHQEQGKGCKQ